MGEDEGDQPDDALGAATAARFDFSALTHFDARSVPVIGLQIEGLLCVRRNAAPLSASLSESCGEPTCRYRAHELVLHASRHAMFANFALRATASGLPLDIVIDGLMIDVWSVRSGGAVRTADLGGHTILDDVRLTAERLRSQRATSTEWELVRTLRDFCHTEAVRLPGSGFEGQQLIVHDSLASDLRLERRGSLTEVLPILPEGLSSENLAYSLARRLRRRRRLWPIPRTDRKGS